MMKQSVTKSTTKTSFERIIASELPASIIFRDSKVCAFLDIHPYNPGHTLVVPCFKAASLSELPSEYATAMFAVGQKIGVALRSSSITCEGFNLKLNDGVAAGQDVMHCHLHVIPRFSGDKLSSGSWGQIASEPWDESRRAEFDRIAADIKACLT